MPKHTRQKLKLLYLRDLLLDKSDENHPLSAGEMITSLEREGIQAERKSIYDDMAALEEYGMDVVCRRGRGGGWFIGRRDFQLPELKLLVDAVQSCRFITADKSAELIHKLEKLAGSHQARQLQRQVYVAGRSKTENKTVYYSIDKLHTALTTGKVVTFQYFRYTVDKRRSLRHGGARYRVSPYGLVWDMDCYYLVCYDHDREEIRHYRVDRMVDIEVQEEPRQEAALHGGLDMSTYSQKHFGMFMGREARVRLRCCTGMEDVMLDRFGQDVMLVPDGPDHFLVTVPVVVSPQFMGWLFGLKDNVKLLGPDWVVGEYRTHLRKVADLYANGEMG